MNFYYGRPLDPDICIAVESLLEQDILLYFPDVITIFRMTYNVVKISYEYCSASCGNRDNSVNKWFPNCALRGPGESQLPHRDDKILNRVSQKVEQAFISLNIAPGHILPITKFHQMRLEFV
ncbi:hypothetical protein AVEN_163553-1 [Araneus ventricosus]|uniref:Uncharacterized protein n=1 Tax=Araneus ventricosus TaxID=182803 RepID=A0A4Y2UC12_ARAVE|nr:hypothetical protein AVEN_163553-1 [Araneus ventricosus]